MELIKKQIQLLDEELVALFGVLRTSGIYEDRYNLTLEKIERLNNIRTDLLFALRMGK